MTVHAAENNPGPKLVAFQLHSSSYSTLQQSRRSNLTHWCMGEDLQLASLSNLKPHAM